LNELSQACAFARVRHEGDVMGELRLVATMVRHLLDTYRGSVTVGRALTEWAETNAAWLTGAPVEGVATDLRWLDAAVAQAMAAPDETDPLVGLAAAYGLVHSANPPARPLRVTRRD
jgi:hypothetical protein